MRGVTFKDIGRVYDCRISTHTPHAGRDDERLAHPKIDDISTHTPHAGRDDVFYTVSVGVDNFNSHAPCGA